MLQQVEGATEACDDQLIVDSAASAAGQQRERQTDAAQGEALQQRLAGLQQQVEGMAQQAAALQQQVEEHEQREERVQRAAKRRRQQQELGQTPAAPAAPCSVQHVGCLRAELAAARAAHGGLALPGVGYPPPPAAAAPSALGLCAAAPAAAEPYGQDCQQQHHTQHRRQRQRSAICTGLCLFCWLLFLFSKYHIDR